MNKVVLLVFGLLITISCNASEYYQKAITGAKTVSYIFREFDIEPCKFQHTIKNDAIPIIQEIEKMGLLEIKDEFPNPTPDLIVLALLETFPKTIDDKEVCPFIVKFDVIHSMEGTFRYWESPDLIRAIAYRESAYGVVTKEELNEAISQTALKLLANFGFEYLKTSNKQVKKD